MCVVGSSVLQSVRSLDRSLSLLSFTYAAFLDGDTNFTAWVLLEENLVASSPSWLVWDAFLVSNLFPGVWCMIT